MCTLNLNVQNIFRFTVHQFMFCMNNFFISAVLLQDHLNTVYIFHVMQYIRIAENLWQKYCISGTASCLLVLSVAAKDMGVYLSISSKCVKKCGRDLILLSPALLEVWTVFVAFCTSWSFWDACPTRNQLIYSSNRSLSLYGCS